MKEYSKSGYINPCRFKKEDLLELVEILKESFPPSNRKEYFEISTNFHGVYIRSNDIEEFLKHKELPDKLSRLSLRIIGWSENREIDKTVCITFYDNYISLNVNGKEQAWVLGKYVQIKDFLKKKRPWFWALNKAFPFIVGIIPVPLLEVLVSFIKRGEIIYSLSTTLFLLALLFTTIFYFKGTFLPYTQIILNPKKTILSKENIAIIIALLTLIFTIIGGIIVPLFMKK